MRLSRKLRARQLYVLGFLRLIRLPNLLIIVLTQYLVRIFLVGPATDWQPAVLDFRFFLVVLSTVMVAAAGYIINDYYDIKIDTINKPRRVVVGRILKRRIAMGAHTALNWTGVLLASFASLWLGLITFLAAFLLWVYSNRLKQLPLVGNLTIALLTAISLLVVLMYHPRNEMLVYIYAVFAFFISLIREIIKDMEDVRGDATFGCRTLPIVWGIRRTKWVLYALIVVFITVIFALSAHLDNSIFAYFGLFILLPVGWLVYRLIIADTKKEFGYLSSLCKVIMLTGVLSMVLA